MRRSLTKNQSVFKSLLNCTSEISLSRNAAGREFQRGRLKTRDWKTRHQTAGVENAGLENAAPDCRGGKRGSSTVWKAEVSVI